jgi:hypothetical protein
METKEIKERMKDKEKLQENYNENATVKKETTTNSRVRNTK